MRYLLESARLGTTLSDKENSKPVAILFKDKKFEDNAKLKRQEKRVDKIIPGPRTTLNVEVKLIARVSVIFNRNSRLFCSRPLEMAKKAAYS